MWKYFINIITLTLKIQYSGDLWVLFSIYSLYNEKQTFKFLTPKYFILKQQNSYKLIIIMESILVPTRIWRWLVTIIEIVELHFNLKNFFIINLRTYNLTVHIHTSCPSFPSYILYIFFCSSISIFYVNSILLFIDH